MKKIYIYITFFTKKKREGIKQIRNVFLLDEEYTSKPNKATSLW